MIQPIAGMHVVLIYGSFGQDLETKALFVVISFRGIFFPSKVGTQVTS